MNYLHTLTLTAIAGAMLLTASCKEEKKAEEPVAVEEPAVKAHENITLSGTVDKYPVVMVLQCVGDSITGYNYYVRGTRKISADLQLKGTLKEDGTLELFEWVEANGQHSSHFLGCFSAEQGYQGKFDRADGKEMMFAFTVDSLSVDASANTPLGFSRTKPANFTDLVEQYRNAPVNHSWFLNYDENADFGGRQAVSSAESGEASDGSDVDAYLDSYERCLNKYVSFMKKMDKNNPTAVKDAAEYYAELYELSQKAEQMKGQMNDAQLKRLMRILQEFNRAMQQYGQQ
ncbi:MAG: hypothetical protein IJS89_03325 [Bacteroidaceae bacterium]|nr:hypothetical protein [Bacteroidaceae bacterium]